MAVTLYPFNPDSRGYEDLESLLRGNFDTGALHVELGTQPLPPKPQVVWDVQTGHRRRQPAPEPKAPPEPPEEPEEPAPEPLGRVGPPGYRPKGGLPAQRATAPGEFFAAYRRPPKSGRTKDHAKLMAAVNNLAGEHQEIIDNILGQCDKVSRMILYATANALREAHESAQKPMSWLATRAAIKKELAHFAGLEEMHRLLDMSKIDMPDDNNILLRFSSEEKKQKEDMEALFRYSVKRLKKNGFSLGFDLDRVQKRLTLHRKDAESVLQHTGAIDSDYNGKATQIALKHGEASAMAALKSYETGQHKIFNGYAQTLKDASSTHKPTWMPAMPALASPKLVPSFARAQSDEPEPLEDKDLSVEQQKKNKEKKVADLKATLETLLKQKKDEEEEVVEERVASKKADGMRLQQAEGLEEMDAALTALEEEREAAKRSMEGGPQVARMVEFMDTGQHNLRHLLDDLVRIEKKQAAARRSLYDLVTPECRQLVHEMVRNREIAIELLDANVLPITDPNAPETEHTTVSQMIADSKNVTNAQLVAAARKRQQLREHKEAQEAELEERREAAVAEKAAKAAESARQEELRKAEQDSSDAGLLKQIKAMVVQGNMLLSDIRAEQKDQDAWITLEAEGLLEQTKDILQRTGKALANKEEPTGPEVVKQFSDEFQEVQIAVLGLKLANQERKAKLERTNSLRQTSFIEAATSLQDLQEELEAQQAANAQRERRLKRVKAATVQEGARAKDSMSSATDEAEEPLARSNSKRAMQVFLQRAQSGGVDAKAVAAPEEKTESETESIGSEFNSEADEVEEPMRHSSTISVAAMATGSRSASGTGPSPSPGPGSPRAPEPPAEPPAEPLAEPPAEPPLEAVPAVSPQPRQESVASPLSPKRTAEEQAARDSQREARRQVLHQLKMEKLANESLMEEVARARRELEELRARRAAEEAAGALLAPPGVAPVKAPEAPKIYTPKEPGCEEGKIGTMRKMSLLPPRKMAELPVDEAQERLKMNLMLFHRRAGDNSRADAPTLLPPVAPLPVPMVAKPEEIAPLWPKKAPLPHFSSLKGGVPKLQLGELQPLSARRASRTERSGTPDASEVNQKAREMLKYLQSFERAPLQRVLSSRERRRSRSRSRSPCDPDAKTQTPRLPPIEKEGGHVSAQAAAWHQFLEQRLGRHIRSFSKSSPPSRVESRDIRSLVLD